MAVFAGNGSNTAPSFTFSSDTNTGIFRPSADTVAIACNGTQVFTVDEGTGSTGATAFGGITTYNSGIASDGSYTLSVAADGTIQIAAGAALNGLYIIKATGNNRVHYTQVSVEANQFDTSTQIQVLQDYGYLGQDVLTNFKIVGDASGATRCLVCNVGNRNGAAVTVSVMAIGASPNVSLSTTPSGSTTLTNRWHGYAADGVVYFGGDASSATASINAVGNVTCRTLNNVGRYGLQQNGTSTGTGQIRVSGLGVLAGTVYRGGLIKISLATGRLGGGFLEQQWAEFFVRYSGLTAYSNTTITRTAGDSSVTCSYSSSTSSSITLSLSFTHTATHYVAVIVDALDQIGTSALAEIITPF